MIHDVEEKVEYGKSEASEKEKEDKVRGTSAAFSLTSRELREVREKATRYPYLTVIQAR